MSKRRLWGLDFVKIIAIFWICLYHLLDFRNKWTLGLHFDKGTLFQYFTEHSNAIKTLFQSLLSLGIIGVNIFFIASGVGLAISQKNKTFKMFFLRRIMKIFPTYWLFLSITLLHFLFKGLNINWLDFLVHYAGIHSFFPEFTYGISTPLWFVGVILQLYLLFPILHRMYQKIHPILFFGIIIFLQILLNPLLSQTFVGGRFFTEFIIEFCIGIHIGKLILNKRVNFGLKKLSILLLPGLISLILLINKNTWKLPPHLIKPIFVVAGISLFISLFSIGENIKSKWLKNLSLLIYPLYLVHYFVLTELMPQIPRFSFFTDSIIFLGISLIAAYCLNATTSKIEQSLSLALTKKISS